MHPATFNSSSSSAIVFVISLYISCRASLAVTMVMKSIYGSHTICYDPEHVFGRALWKQYGAVHLPADHCILEDKQEQCNYSEVHNSKGLKIIALNRKSYVVHLLRSPVCTKPAIIQTRTMHKIVFF